MLLTFSWIGRTAWKSQKVCIIEFWELRNLEGKLLWFLTFFLLMEEIDLILFFIILFWNYIVSFVINRCLIFLTSITAKFSIFLLLLKLFFPFMIIYVLILFEICIFLGSLFEGCKTIILRVIIIKIDVKVIELNCSNGHHFITVKRAFLIEFISSLFCRTVHVL